MCGEGRSFRPRIASPLMFSCLGQVSVWRCIRNSDDGVSCWFMFLAASLFPETVSLARLALWPSLHQASEEILVMMVKCSDEDVATNTAKFSRMSQPDAMAFSLLRSHCPYMVAHQIIWRQYPFLIGSEYNIHCWTRKRVLPVNLNNQICFFVRRTKCFIIRKTKSFLNSLTFVCTSITFRLPVFDHLPA